MIVVNVEWMKKKEPPQPHVEEAWVSRMLLGSAALQPECFQSSSVC